MRTQFSRAFSGSVSFRYRHTERRVSGQETEADTYFLVVKASYVFDSFRFCNPSQRLTFRRERHEYAAGGVEAHAIELFRHVDEVTLEQLV